MGLVSDRLKRGWVRMVMGEGRVSSRRGSIGMDRRGVFWRDSNGGVEIWGVGSLKSLW